MIVQFTRDVILNEVTHKRGDQMTLKNPGDFNDVYMIDVTPAKKESVEDDTKQTPKKITKEK